MSIGQLDPNPCRSLCPDLCTIKWGLKMRKTLLVSPGSSIRWVRLFTRQGFWLKKKIFFFSFVIGWHPVSENTSTSRVWLKISFFKFFNGYGVVKTSCCGFLGQSYYYDPWLTLNSWSFLTPPLITIIGTWQRGMIFTYDDFSRMWPHMKSRASVYEVGETQWSWRRWQGCTSWGRQLWKLACP